MTQCVGFVSSSRWPRAWPILLCALALLAQGVASVNAVPRQAPGSRIVLDLEGDWAEAKDFSGFVLGQTGASILVAEFPADAWAAMASGFTVETLNQRFAKATVGRLPRAGDHVYATFEQATTAGVFAKFLLLLRGPDNVALITVNVPKAGLGQAGLTPAALERALASATFAAAAREAEPVFTVGDLGPFKAAGALAGQTRIFTLSGAMGPAQKGQPLLVIAPSLDRRLRVLTSEGAAGLLGTVAGLVDVRAEPGTPTTIGGREAMLTAAIARDVDTGAPMSVLQAMILRPDGGYVRLLAIVPAADAADLMPHVRRIADTVRVAP
jgi:hypothetical protein